MRSVRAGAQIILVSFPELARPSSMAGLTLHGPRLIGARTFTRTRTSFATAMRVAVRDSFCVRR
jgi:hypothetical protein